MVVRVVCGDTTLHERAHIYATCLFPLECAHRMKKCIKCQVTITKKIRQGRTHSKIPCACSAIVHCSSPLFGLRQSLTAWTFFSPADQTEVDSSPNSESSEQHHLLEQLQSRYRQMEERITCPICIDNHIKLVFQCGHASCMECSSALKTCPICRQSIRERIQLFVWCVHRIHTHV